MMATGDNGHANKIEEHKDNNRIIATTAIASNSSTATEQHRDRNDIGTKSDHHHSPHSTSPYYAPSSPPISNNNNSNQEKEEEEEEEREVKGKTSTQLLLNSTDFSADYLLRHRRQRSLATAIREENVSALSSPPSPHSQLLPTEGQQQQKSLPPPAAAITTNHYHSDNKNHNSPSPLVAISSSFSPTHHPHHNWSSPLRQHQRPVSHSLSPIKDNHNLGGRESMTSFQSPSMHHQQLTFSPSAINDDVPICRVCRSEATPEQPLFYPCLCSGSIKYIHQDCLVEWLKHSRKRYCELCKHEFTFDALYKEGVRPDRLGLLALCWGVFLVCFKASLRLSRWILSLVVWTWLLPWSLTGQSRLFLGWPSLANVLGSRQAHPFLACFLDTLQGLVMMLFEVLVLVLLFILYEYVEAQYGRDELANEESETRTTNNAAPATPVVIGEEEVRISGFEGITAREYRAYLRRQRIYRERIEREQARLRESLIFQSQAAVGSTMTPAFTSSINSNHGQLLASGHGNSTGITLDVDDNQSTVSVTTSVRSSTTADTFTSHVTNATATANIRCRVCNSRTCVSIEHLRIASQRQRELQQQQQLQHQIIENTQTTELRTIPVEIQTVPVQTQPNTQPRIIEASIEIDLEEVLGLKGPVWNVARYAALVFLLNLVLFLVLVKMPYMLGRLWQAGYVQAFCGLLWESSVEFVHRAVLLVTSSNGGSRRDISTSVDQFMIGHGNSWIRSARIILRFVQRKARFWRFLALSWIDEHDTTLSYNAGFKDYISCLGLGYGTTAIMLVLVHRLTSKQSLINELLETVFGMTKMLFMLGVELGALPALVGCMLHCFMTPLLPSNHDTLDSIATFIISWPCLSTIVHWFIGIVYMLYMATLVNKCRRILRPGLLHRLRDPSDPDFAPFREMLMEPMFIQFIRLTKTLTIHALLALCNVFTFVHITTWSMPWFKLNITFSEPWSQITSDLFFKTCLRVALHYAQPLYISQALERYFVVTSRFLGISSYVRGKGRYLREEQPLSKGGKWCWMPSAERVYPQSKLKEAIKKPVEPLDIARLPIIEGPVTGTRTPLLSPGEDEDPGQQPLLRRFPVRRVPMQAPTSIIDPLTFAPVYLPPWFSIRLTLFMIFLWASNVLAHLVLFVTPCLIGRSLIALVQDLPMNELFSWTLGMCVMLVLVKGVLSAGSALIDRGVTLHDLFIHWPRCLFKATILLSVVFILWPGLCGIYLMTLVWPLLASETNALGSSLSISMPVSVWMCGFMALKTGFIARDFLISTPTRLDLINDVVQGLPLSLFTFPFATVMRLVILPWTVKAMLVTFAPPLACVLFGPLFGLQSTQVKLLQQWSGLAALIVPVTLFTLSLLRQVHEWIRERVMRDVFAIGVQLRNLEPSHSSSAGGGATSHHQG